MKCPKKMFSAIAVVLCLSLCMGSVSHAKTIIRYKKTRYDCPFDDLNTVLNDKIRIDSNGKIVLSLYNKKNSGSVVFGSNGKKKSKKANAGKVSYSNNGDVELYGNKTYEVRKKRVTVKTKKGKAGRYKNELVVRTKKGDIIKKINLDVSRFLKKKNDYVILSIAHIEKNKVLLYYRYFNYNASKSYGGLVEVNIKTGKIKKIVSSDKFYLECYDGKYVYGRILEPDGFGNIPHKATFYMISLKTKKIKKLNTNAISFDEKKYPSLTPMYTFYNGKVMGIEPGGKVYYGTFSSGKFEQVGDISECKNFQNNAVSGFEMKSRDEFYISYCSNIKRGEEILEPAGGIFIIKYKNK